MGALVLLLLSLRSHAGNYDVAGIPQAMRANAHAVIRTSETDILISSANHVRVRKHLVITVQDEEGKGLAAITEFTSRYSKLNAVEGTLYDAAGEKISEMSRKDMRRFSIHPELIFYSDLVGYEHRFNRSDYPYTVEYEIEEQHSQSFNLPRWDPKPSAHCAVEHARLTVTASSAEQLHYKTFKLPEPGKAGPPYSISWELRQLPATAEEEHTDPSEYTRPVVLLTLSPFRLDDYQGESSSWGTFGRFMYELNKGREALGKKDEEKVLQLVKDKVTAREKTETLYHYLQSNCRYVSLEYGIGGWQTLEASFVAGNGIGDCKALTNYMMAMLAVAGVRSYPVLIQAGKVAGMMMDERFPINQFNHVILCVPLEKDSLWLECTSNITPPGYLGSFTDDRDALMITPEGGVKVRTPAYSDAQNFWHRHARSSFDPGTGLLTVAAEEQASGMFREPLLYAVKDKTEQEKSEYLNSLLAIPSYNVTRYRYYDSSKRKVPVLYEHLEYTSASLVRSQGARLFVVMDLLPVSGAKVAEEPKRVHAFFIPRAFAIRDTFSLEIPAGFIVENVPADTVLSYPFGDYALSWKNADGLLTAVRSFRLRKGRFPAEQYQAYAALRNLASRNKKMAVVLKRE